MGNAKGNTPLHGAVRMGRIEVVRWLLRMGVEPRSESKEPFDGLEVKGRPAELARAVGGPVGEEMTKLLDGWEREGRGRRRKEA